MRFVSRPSWPPAFVRGMAAAMLALSTCIAACGGEIASDGEGEGDGSSDAGDGRASDAFPFCPTNPPKPGSKCTGWDHGCAYWYGTCTIRVICKDDVWTYLTETHC